jgi:hypothetical protein
MKHPVPKFTLWLEFEIGDPDQPANSPIENFCNFTVTTETGLRYAITAWTFDYLPFARYDELCEPDRTKEPAKYVLPPDLFVERLDRPTIEAVVQELFMKGRMKAEWLCDSQDK